MPTILNRHSVTGIRFGYKIVLLNIEHRKPKTENRFGGYGTGARSPSTSPFIKSTKIPPPVI